MSGYPSILEPQLKTEPDSGIFLDCTSEGLVVSLDYGSTIFISVVAGWLQVSSLGSVLFLHNVGFFSDKVWTTEDHTVCLPSHPDILGVHGSS